MSEAILIGGYPASGKTTVAKTYTDKGYTRLNRDIAGGSVDDLNINLKGLLKAGKNVVMDNLYASKQSRAGAIQIAKETGADIKFVLQNTSLEDAQFNACIRMMEKCGKVLAPEDKTNKDPNLFPVAVIYKYRKDFEQPTTSEGFSEVTTAKFVRQYPADWVNKAVIYDFDGTLRQNSGAEKYPTKRSEVHAIKGREKRIKEWEAKGYISLGASNQSGIAKGILTCEDAEACFDETLKQLGISMKEVLYCPHRVPPISCYCRKPGPGMGVQLIHKYKLDPRQCIYVGDMKTDKTFAGRCGFKFIDHDEFFR